MFFILLYYFLIAFEVIFAISIAFYMISLVYSSFKGSPFVRTNMKEGHYILKEAHLKKGQVFYELGCGDGRITREAVKKYKVKGVGIDVNPLLIMIARLGSAFEKVKGTDYKVQNIFDADLSKADYVYIFLMPELIHKFEPLLKKQLKKGAIVISHGFKIVPWKKCIVKKIDHEPFPTYFYKPSML